MFRALMLALVTAIASSGCQQLPLTPEDLEARKFEAVADKAVIYVVRDAPDFSDVRAQIRLGDNLLFNTYPGTYYRWEAPPGKHRIDTGFYDTGALTLEVKAGGIYFVQQRVLSLRGNPSSTFELIGEAPGRAAVLRAVLLAPQP